MRKTFNIGCGALLLVAVVTLVTVAAFGLNPGYESYATSNQRSPTRTEACLMAQDFVTQQLKAPASAQFPSPTTDNCQTAQDGNKWFVTSYVDAQNSYGALIRSDYGVEMNYKPSDSTWHLVDVAIVDP